MLIIIQDNIFWRLFLPSFPCPCHAAFTNLLFPVRLQIIILAAQINDQFNFYISFSSQNVRINRRQSGFIRLIYIPDCLITENHLICFFKGLIQQFKGFFIIFLSAPDPPPLLIRAFFQSENGHFGLVKIIGYLPGIIGYATPYCASASSFCIKNTCRELSPSLAFLYVDIKFFCDPLLCTPLLS